MSMRFDYATAFSRNIGWLTPTEQALLRGRRIAIAGLGGVGGAHLLTLTRLGIGAFTIADFDHFELHNFNRQVGATLPNLQRPKLDAMAEAARNINPELDLRLFAEAIGSDNIERFLDDVDIYVDSLDFFAVEARRQVFAACARRGIPAITAAPLGMGTAVLTFLPGRMSFEEYFGLEGKPEREQLARFLIGLSPAMLQRGYLVDPSAVNFIERRGPSTPMACDLATGALASDVLKILLGRGKVYAAPWGTHFDAYRNKLVHTWRPGGNRHPLQRLALMVARRILSRSEKLSRPERSAPLPVLDTRVQCVLDLGRWAPSGDNTQPWRFEAVGPLEVIVHGCDTRDHVIYDLFGRASQLALGGLLETLDIAASGEGLRCSCERLANVDDTSPDWHPLFRLQFSEAADDTPHPLLRSIEARCTQRRMMQRTPLDARRKAALDASVGAGFSVIWLEGEQRSAVAKLLFRNAHVRLTTPEAYPVHRDIIEYGVQYSEDRLPDRAVGLDPIGVALMKWAMRSWERVNFLNTYCAGTWLPRIQLDWLPGLFCAAHFMIVADTPPRTLDDRLAAGRAMQRFWLTATQLGLQFQPEMTPLIFASYIREGIPFTGKQASVDSARWLAGEFERLLGADAAARGVYFGRVGFGSVPQSRSTRLPLAKLVLNTTSA